MPKIELQTLLGLVGELNDSNEHGSASARFRKYLQENIQQADDVRAYVSDALAQSGDQFNKALQDLINHVGQLLGFTVVYGRYRGVRGEIGFDGLWQSPTGWFVVVETKTTDVYTIKTATLLGYINDLVSAGQIPNPNNALGLYVYGRFDAQTGQLENAISIEGRRERLRVVSVDALLNLLELQQEYELGHDTILGLLLPAPVRVDALVNLIFDIVAQEKQEAGVAQVLPETDDGLTVVKLACDESLSQGAKSTLVAIAKDYKGKTARAVRFYDEWYEAHTWKEAAMAVFEAARRRNAPQFEEAAVTIVGRKRPYITRNQDKLRYAAPIPNTPLYFETNLSSNSMVKLCYTLITRMGYDREVLQFETEE